MGTVDDPFIALLVEEPSRPPEGIGPGTLGSSSPLPRHSGAAVGRFIGFDVDETPVIGALDSLPGQVVRARTTVTLRQEHIGSTVVILNEADDPQRPIIVGVIQEAEPASLDMESRRPAVCIQADEERYLISAEKEIVLRCGEASITLTRAGKVIIKGNYILSRSTGYNRIKGAAIDIN
jgi:hypothetical protein